eukprot:scaffold148849_cov49-Attheya_sp.AAC.1
MSVRLNELQNASVGMTVGVIEVSCLQPLNYAKNMVQQGQPLTMDPKKLYRGVGANMVNMGSCTMIQFAMGGKLKQLVAGTDADGKALRSVKPHEEMLCGIGAGITSALVGGPLELIMIQQQRKGGSTVATLGTIATPNTFYRGFIGAATAKMIFAESKIPGFFRGATFRYGRMVIAVALMDTLKDAVGPLLYPKAFE